MFPSLKMNGPVYYDTLLERDYVYLLEYAVDVNGYYIRPSSIEWSKTKLAPTFLVVRNDRKTCVELARESEAPVRKPTRRVAAVKEWCATRDIEFEVMTDAAIRSGYLLENVKYLHRFARHIAPSEVQDRIRQEIARSDAQRVEDVIDAFEPSERGRAYSALMNMVWNHEIHIPIELTPIPRCYAVSK